MQMGRAMHVVLMAAVLAACTAVPAPTTARTQNQQKSATSSGSAYAGKAVQKRPLASGKGTGGRALKDGSRTIAAPVARQAAVSERADSTPASAPASASAAPAPAVRIGPPRLSWPADAPITTQFGVIAGGRRGDGMDLSLLPGQRIVSAAAGSVLFAGFEPLYGQLVILDHGGGWMTAYGFVGQITVKEGDPVTARERIGVNGTRSRTLHFQLRRDNEPLDPQPFLPIRL